MIGYENLAGMVPMKFTSHAAHGCFVLEQFLSRYSTQANNVLGANCIQLSLVVFTAIGSFFELGIAIAGRTTFDGVENVDIVP